MLHVKALSLACLLALGVNTSLTVYASENSFNQAYDQYQAAVKEGDIAAAEKYAASAYQLGEAQFAKESVDLANLAMNWASALKQQAGRAPHSEENQENTSQAHDLYTLALTNYRAKYGAQGIELIDPLIGLAQTTKDNKVARDQLSDALDIAEANNNQKLAADVKIVTFQRLSKTDLYTRSMKENVFEAYDYYKENQPENALDRVNATYFVGALEFFDKHDSKAEPLLLEVVKQFDALDYTHPYALSAHAYLVEMYERQGKSELSTAHCIAIGSMRPWSDVQEQTPLFRVAPKYPVSAAKARQSGWVQLKFTVDELGFVKNPEVIDSEGGNKFERESLKALDKWRYAPKFEDGKAVAAQTTVMLEYKI